MTGAPDPAGLGLPLPLTGRTALFAILGDPIVQAGSPALFNAAFRQRGWSAVLVPMHVRADDLEPVLRGLRRIANLHGLVLTTPHKTAALDLVDSLGPEAQLVGSINAIRCGRGGHWHGENFDGLGCVTGLNSAGHILAGKKVLVVGSGGAGRAVAAAVARQRPAVLRLNDLDAARVNSVRDTLARAFHDLNVETGSADPAGFDVVINCTPLGMAARRGMAVAPERLAARTVVADLVVEPEMTDLLAAASANGCSILPGLRTLAGQVEAVCAFFEGADNG